MKYLFLALVLTACTDESATVHTLQDSGFTDIQTDGYDWLACGHDDTSATRFHAKNASGRAVSGVVCCGIVFKACTVRF